MVMDATFDKKSLDGRYTPDLHCTMSRIRAERWCWNRSRFRRGCVRRWGDWQRSGRWWWDLGIGPQRNQKWISNDIESVIRMKHNHAQNLDKGLSQPFDLLLVPPVPAVARDYCAFAQGSREANCP